MQRDRQVQDLLVRSASYLDEDQLEQWVELFEEDAVYRVTTAESLRKGYPVSIIHCEGRHMLEDRIAALRNANIYEPHTYCHVLSLPQRKQTDGEEVIETRFIVTRIFEDGRTDVFATGKYIDRYTDGDEDCRIKSRIVVLDSRAIDVLLVIPL
ncbi:nuclear transport factor 2 family protein [Alcaligenaceae bacterium]|nr:nuclear transport factor 2 family protein [Alcaligenaceae bacterium]